MSWETRSSTPRIVNMQVRDASKGKRKGKDSANSLTPSVSLSRFAPKPHPIQTLPPGPKSMPQLGPRPTSAMGIPWGAGPSPAPFFFHPPAAGQLPGGGPATPFPLPALAFSPKGAFQGPGMGMTVAQAVAAIGRPQSAAGMQSAASPSHPGSNLAGRVLAQGVVTADLREASTAIEKAAPEGQRGGLVSSAGERVAEQAPSASAFGKGSSVAAPSLPELPTSSPLPSQAGTRLGRAETAEPGQLSIQDYHFDAIHV